VAACNLRSVSAGGVLAAALLAGACSHQERAARAPGRSPTFESSVPSEAAAGDRIDEQNLCDTLSHDGKPRVEDTPGGAVLIFSAKNGGVNQPLRNEVTILQTALSPTGTPLTKSPGDNGCGLRELRDDALIVAVEETPDGMRLHLTSSDPARVQEVRQDARFVADRLR